MKDETKLWLRKKFLMTLRSLLWHADEWLHAREVELREDLSGRHQVPELAATSTGKTDQSQDMPHRAPGRSETYLQWEARRSGIAVISKKQAREHRRQTAAEFDLRFAR